MPDDPKTPALTATVNPPVTMPVGTPPSWTVVELAALARDLAIGMYDLSVILSKHMITAAEHKAIMAMPYFQKLLEQAATEWNKPTNINDRLALEAAVGLEIAMPSIISRMKVQNEPLQGIVQAAKVLTEIAGAGGSKDKAQGPQEKFKIVINLGGEPRIVEKSVQIDQNPAPGEVQTVQSITLGEGTKAPVCPVPAGEKVPTHLPAISRRETE